MEMFIVHSYGLVSGSENPTMPHIPTLAVLDVGICRYAGKGQSEQGMLRSLWDLFLPGDGKQCKGDGILRKIYFGYRILGRPPQETAVVATDRISRSLKRFPDGPIHYSAPHTLHTAKNKGRAPPRPARSLSVRDSR
jgi:hypothetical protein